MTAAPSPLPSARVSSNEQIGNHPQARDARADAWTSDARMAGAALGAVRMDALEEVEAIARRQEG